MESMDVMVTTANTTLMARMVLVMETMQTVITEIKTTPQLNNKV